MVLTAATSEPSLESGSYTVLLIVLESALPSRLRAVAAQHERTEWPQPSGETSPTSQTDQACQAFAGN